VAAQRGIDDFGPFGGDGEGELLDVLADAVQETVAGGDHAAGEDDHVRVDGVHHVHGADRQVVGGVLDELFGEGVPLLGGVEDVAGAEAADLGVGGGEGG